MAHLLRRLLSVVLHPVLFYRAKKLQEQTMLMSLVGMHLKIDKPSVYDVDILHREMNSALALLYLNPKMLDSFPKMKSSLFWSALLSKFMLLEVSREDVKRVIDVYSQIACKLESSGLEPSTANASVVLIAMLKNWSCL